MASSLDSGSGEGSHVCHSCYAKRNADVDAEWKTVEKGRRAIEKGASGVDIIFFSRNGSAERVVEAKTAPFIAQAPNSPEFLSL